MRHFNDLSLQDLANLINNEINEELTLPEEAAQVIGIDELPMDLSTPLEIPPRQHILQDKSLESNVTLPGFGSVEHKLTYLSASVYLCGGKVFYQQKNKQLVASIEWQ